MRVTLLLAFLCAVVVGMSLMVPADAMTIILNPRRRAGKTNRRRRIIHTHRNSKGQSYYNFLTAWDWLLHSILKSLTMAGLYQFSTVRATLPEKKIYHSPSLCFEEEIITLNIFGSSELFLNEFWYKMSFLCLMQKNHILTNNFFWASIVSDSTSWVLLCSVFLTIVQLSCWYMKYYLSFEKRKTGITNWPVYYRLQPIVR